MSTQEVFRTLLSPFIFPPTVLVVDEPTGVRDLLCESIFTAGFIVLPANNAIETQEHLKIVIPDAVLLDATSPDIGGFDLGRRIKSMPDWIRIPILFMIEQANTQQIIGSYENGGIGYISKPLCIPEVLARLLTCVTARFHDSPPKALAECLQCHSIQLPRPPLH